MREIAVPWTCGRSGDCCTQTPAVVMTQAERAEIDAAVPDVAPTLVWSAHPTDPRRTLLRAGPCPLLTRDADGAASCSVYAVRPYVCRRFMCGRPDPAREPFEAGGPLGCVNLTDRLEQSLRFYEHYRTTQRHAQREWAAPHGWQKEMTT